MKKDKNKQLQKTETKETSIVRSSAAEYLTFVAATGKNYNTLYYKAFGDIQRFFIYHLVSFNNSLLKV